MALLPDGQLLIRVSSPGRFQRAIDLTQIQITNDVLVLLEAEAICYMQVVSHAACSPHAAIPHRKSDLQTTLQSDPRSDDLFLLWHLRVMTQLRLVSEFLKSF